MVHSASQNNYVVGSYGIIHQILHHQLSNLTDHLLFPVSADKVISDYLGHWVLTPVLNLQWNDIKRQQILLIWKMEGQHFIVLRKLFVALVAGQVIRSKLQYKMIATVLFDFLGHFQTNYHSVDMNVIKFNINKKDFIVCSMPQNSTISQSKHVTLLPGLVTMVTMKNLLLYQVHDQTTVKWSTKFD